MQEDNNIRAQLEESPSVKYNDNKPTNKKSSAFSKNTNVEMEVQPKDRPKKAVTHKV